jgi:hypothetical protein
LEHFRILQQKFILMTILEDVGVYMGYSLVY